MRKGQNRGITNKDNVLATVNFGADALGFVFYPQSPKSVNLESVKRMKQLNLYL
jgi:phosphoribosylanthranilate isomerase